MGWRRFSYGNTKESAEEQVRYLRKQGDKAKITKGKMGYSVLMWIDLRGKHRGLRPKK